MLHCTLIGLTLAGSICTCTLPICTHWSVLPLTHLGCGLSAGQALDVTEAAAPPRRTKAMERGPCRSTATPVLTGSMATRIYQRLEGKATVSALRDRRKLRPRFSPRVRARLLTTTPRKPPPRTQAVFSPRVPRRPQPRIPCRLLSNYTPLDSSSTLSPVTPPTWH